MALVVCPECKKNDVSEYAESCPNCGFPIKQYLSDNNFTDSNKSLMCPNCLDVYARPGKMNTVCEYCNTTMVQTQTDVDDYLEEYLGNISNNEKCNMARKNLEERLMKEANITSFSQEAYNERFKKLKEENTGQSSSTQSTKPSNPIKCPNCQSTYIKKIGTGKRVASIIGFGILSSNIGKTYECLDCKYKW